MISDSALTECGEELLLGAPNCWSMLGVDCAFFPLPLPLPLPLAGVAMACCGWTSSEMADTSASTDSVA